MTTEQNDIRDAVDELSVALWPVMLPVDVAVVVPSRVAQVALREYPLRGGRLGLPVIVVGGSLFRLTFAFTGSWWVLRLPYPVDAVFSPHEHRVLPVVVRGRVGVECTVCGWEVEARG